MKVASSQKLTARSLRLALLFVLTLMIAAGGGGFYFGQKMLRDFATETSKLNSQAAQTDQNIANLRSIRQTLANNQLEQQRVTQVVAESQQYKYQDEIIKDISSFAAQSGVSIKNFTFNTSGATSSTGTATPAPATTPTAGATPTTQIAGLKSTTVSFTVDSPVKYTSLLNFVNRIEQNLTKMQIASISLSRDTTKGADLVTTDGFTIEVYIK